MPKELLAFLLSNTMLLLYVWLVHRKIGSSPWSSSAKVGWVVVFILAVLVGTSPCYGAAAFIDYKSGYNVSGGGSIATGSVAVAQHDTLFVGVTFGQNGCAASTRTLSDPALNTYVPVHTLTNGFSGACLATYKVVDAVSFTGVITAGLSPSIGSGIGIQVIQVRGVTGGVETSVPTNPSSRATSITSGSITTTSTDSIILALTGWYLFDTPTIAVGTGGQCASSGCTLAGSYSKGAAEYKILTGAVSSTTVDFQYASSTAGSLSVVVMQAPAIPPYRPAISLIFGEAMGPPPAPSTIYLTDPSLSFGDSMSMIGMDPRKVYWLDGDLYYTGNK